MGSEVTEEWVEHMLTCYERRRDPGAAVEVISYTVNPGAKPGENVASELIKMWVKAKITRETEDEEHAREIQKNENNKTKEYNLMMKFNSGNEMDREYARYTYTDLNELLVYSDVIQEFNAFQEREAGGKYPVAIPEFIYGVCDGDEYVLVMQDVSVLGYKTEPKKKGLDLTHILMAVEQVARLHAVSHAYQQKHDFLERYPSFKTDDRVFCIFFTEFMAIFFDFVVEGLGEREDLRHIAKKMSANRDALLDKFKAMISRESTANRVPCLVHGDAWTNNLMYSHVASADGAAATPKDLLLIDWGLVSWRNAIFDLHLLVYNCTSLSFRKQHLQQILEHYHGIFTAATQDLGAPVANYDFQEFLKEWERTALFGFMQCGIFANSVVHSKRAREGFVKGKLSTGLWSLLAKGLAKIFLPLLMRGWFLGSLISGTRKKFLPLLDELKSGENQHLNTTLADIMKEGYERGLLDP